MINKFVNSNNILAESTDKPDDIFKSVDNYKTIQKSNIKNILNDRLSNLDLNWYLNESDDFFENMGYSDDFIHVKNTIFNEFISNESNFIIINNSIVVKYNKNSKISDFIDGFATDINIDDLNNAYQELLEIKIKLGNIDTEVILSALNGYYGGTLNENGIEKIRDYLNNENISKKSGESINNIFDNFRKNSYEFLKNIINGSIAIKEYNK